MTRVRIADPAKVSTKFHTFTVSLSGPQFALVVAAMTLAQQLLAASDAADLRAALATVLRAEHEPDLAAIAAAFELGEEVPGAELVPEPVLQPARTYIEGIDYPIGGEIPR